MGSQLKNLLLFLGFFLCLLLYLSSKIDWEDMLQPRSNTPVHLNGKIAPKPKSLPNVQIISIPKDVYDGMHTESWKRYITGNQKYVLVMSLGGKPNPSAFKKKLKILFNQKGYREYYRKHFVNLGTSWFVSCNISSQCPKLWLHKNCVQKVCIINPQTKQVVVDSSADVEQLETLLQKYQDW